MLKEYLIANARDVDDALKEFLPSVLDSSWLSSELGDAKYSYDSDACSNAVSAPLWDLLSRGGKRWRPGFMKLCYELVGGKENINLFLPIPEIIHNGTLIVDDVEDRSSLRRGGKSIHLVHGLDVAVNAGNAAYFLPYSIISKSSLSDSVKLKMYELINLEMSRLHFGQAMDIWWHSKGKDVGEKEYMQMCAYKTGTLVRLASKLGVLLADGSSEQEEVLGGFAESLGIAFQIKDDILNLHPSSEWGKCCGDDITEGKRSLLIIHALAHASDDERKRLTEILSLHTSDEDLIKEAIGIIEKQDSFTYCSEFAEDIVLEAWKKVDSMFEESKSKSLLKEFLHYVVARTI